MEAAKMLQNKEGKKHITETEAEFYFWENVTKANSGKKLGRTALNEMLTNIATTYS